MQPGQRVFLTAELAHATVAPAVVEKGLYRGASWVEMDRRDTPVRRSAVEHASFETLTASRSWLLDRYESPDR